jgi:hypothetical protein
MPETPENVLDEDIDKMKTDLDTAMCRFEISDISMKFS